MEGEMGEEQDRKVLYLGMGKEGMGKKIIGGVMWDEREEGGERLL